MRYLTIAVAICLACCGVFGSAKAAKPGCTAKSATPATIEAIRANYADWTGRCVALHGILFKARLYADRRATLEARVAFGEDIRRSIPIRNARRLPDSRLTHAARIVGTIGNCQDAHDAVAAMQAEGGDYLIWVGGYCHTSTETYIDANAVRSSPARIARLTEAEVPTDARELVEAPADTPGLAEQHAVANTMMLAMARGDERTYLRLSRPAVQQELDETGSGERSKWVKRELKEARAEFAKAAGLRRRFAALLAVQPVQERVFAYREDLVEAAEGEAPPSRLITCRCTRPDCAGRWPISRTDADNHPQRPYLCVETSGDSLGAESGSALYANAPAEIEGFEEPIWASSAEIPSSRRSRETKGGRE